MGDEKGKECGMYDKGTGRWLGGFGASWVVEDIEGKARQPRICRTIERTRPAGRPFYSGAVAIPNRRYTQRVEIVDDQWNRQFPKRGVAPFLGQREVCMKDGIHLEVDGRELCH